MSELRIDDSLTNWRRADASAPLLVLLHGYGADENDLFGLVPYLPEGVSVAAVAAPLAPPFPMPGRSWYPIDTGLDGSSRNSDDITAAAQALLAWVDEQVPATHPIALLGFSQGGAVSLQALRLAPERFGAVLNLSGYASPGALPDDPKLREIKPLVFWGRGARDEVIPQALVEHTAVWLPEHSTLSGRVYQGLTHSISEQELVDVRRFLDDWLAALE